MVDKIEITTSQDLAKYLAGFTNSVEKLNRISARFQLVKNNLANTASVRSNIGDARGTKQYNAQLLRELTVLAKSIDKMSMMQQLSKSGRYGQMKDWARQQQQQFKQPYGYNAMDRSRSQMSGMFRNAANPRIDSAQHWFGRRGSAFRGAKTNLNNMTFNRDPEYRNRDASPGLMKTGGRPIPSMFHSAMALGGNVKDFFGAGGGSAKGSGVFDADGNEKPEEKKGLGGKIKGVLKSPLGMIGGIGGAAMLGKKLIDSSPMLQAMMKMLSTTFTLILRPIGDFVGGMLRPITMFMLKEIAIPMAKQGKGFMKFGEEIGNKILGFFLRPIESIKAAIILAINPFAKMFPGYNEKNDKDFQWAKNYNGVTDWKLQKMIDNSEEGSEKQETAKWLKQQQKLGTLSDNVINKSMELLGGNQGTMGLDGSQAFGISAGGLEATSQAEQSIDEFLGFIKQMEASGQITSDEASQMALWMKKAKDAGVTGARNAIDMAATFKGANTAIQAKLLTLYKLQMSMAAQAEAKGGSGSKFKADAADTQSINTSLGSPGTGTPVIDNFFGAGNDRNTNSDPVPISRQLNLADANKKLNDRVNAQAIAAALNPSNGLSYTTRVNKIWAEVKSGRMSQAEGQKMAEGLYRTMKGSAGNINLGTKGSSILRAYEEAKNNGTLGTGKQDQFRTDYSRADAQGDEQGRKDAMNLLGQEGKTWEDYIDGSHGQGTNKGLTDVNGDGKINAYDSRLQKMANGGVINEPIFGIGRSGQKYSFGESGKEFVTPERKAGGTTFNVININVGNISRDADFEKLKPLIQRWILESNSRRGMI